MTPRTLPHSDLFTLTSVPICLPPLPEEMLKNVDTLEERKKTEQKKKKKMACLANKFLQVFP